MAHIPVFDPRFVGHEQSHVIAVELEQGQLLKTIYVGKGVGPIFINNQGDQLYAAAEDDNRIVKIDTSTLEITTTWDNLPLPPGQIILSADESKLYFAKHGMDSIHKIDLNSEQISLATTLTGFQNFT